jgi:hypothetical protein
MERGREIHSVFLLCSSLELDVISEARQPLQMQRLAQSIKLSGVIKWLHSKARLNLATLALTERKRKPRRWQSKAGKLKSVRSDSSKKVEIVSTKRN